MGRSDRSLAKVLLCLLVGVLCEDVEHERPKWMSLSYWKGNKTADTNETKQATQYPCGCANKKGLLAPKVALSEFSIKPDEKCTGPAVHLSQTEGKYCSCDKGKAANWDVALGEAQKAVDDAVSPMVKEMMETISALQEELGMIVDSSSMKKLKPKVTSFPRKEGEGLWVCCCQSHAAGKCRKNAEISGWKGVHHEAPLEACDPEQ
mgnify:FL=1